MNYDVAVAGGGLAGLALSLLLARQGHLVALFEKEQYPFHRVCGEYLSMESWDFLTGLGLPLPAMKPAMIRKLQVSAPSGKILEHSLAHGGFGISRYTLDSSLAELARGQGVYLFEKCKVNQIHFHQDRMALELSGRRINSTVACGSFGKRSNLDVHWKRNFIKAGKKNLNNYIGVKYHIRTEHPHDTISLHNFQDGYCGLVKVEEDKYCLCYLTTSGNLQKAGGSIDDMERMILCKNPHLESIFKNSDFLFNNPLTISQISFDKKSLVENHVLMTGDAAGMITPLCGNGMSMALHAAKLAADAVHLFLSGKISRQVMEWQYTREWNLRFSRRLRAGRFLQGFFGKSGITNTFISLVKPFPRLVNRLIRLTHGDPF